MVIGDNQRMRSAINLIIMHCLSGLFTAAQIKGSYCITGSLIELALAYEVLAVMLGLVLYLAVFKDVSSILCF